MKKRQRLTGNSEQRRRKREKLLELAEYRCAFCGVHNDESRLTVDHKKASSHGGDNTYDNMQMLCGPCNNDKSVLEDTYAVPYSKELAKARILKRAKDRGFDFVSLPL